MTEEVWVLHIRYECEDDICVYRTEQAARDALLTYCRENWTYVVGDEPMPADYDAAYAQYFNDLCEEWQILPVPVRGRG